MSKIKKNNFRNQIIRIKEKLLIAKKNDPNFKKGYSPVHKYELNPPISIEKIKLFEYKNKITLPEEYILFLTKIGNGGTGPYFGLYELDINYYSEHLSKTCKLNPYLLDEEWENLISFQYNKPFDESTEKQYNILFQGTINICKMLSNSENMSEFSIDVVKLVVSGKYKGYIIYQIEPDRNVKPVFWSKANFLDWYECWIDSLIKGDDVTWFGLR